MSINPKSENRRDLIRVITLALAILVFYLPSTRFGFVYDDHHHVLNQPFIRTAAGFLDVFLQPHMSNELYYRPLSRLTILVQKSLTGDEPGWFHLGNVLLMVLLGLQFHFVLKSDAFGVHPTVSAGLALLLAIHPISSSCVYLITGREAILAAIFLLASLHGFFSEDPIRLLGALAAFGAAVFSRENGLTGIVILGIAEAVRRKIRKESDGFGPHPWKWVVLVFWCVSYILLRQRVIGLKAVFVGFPQVLGWVADSFLFAVSAVFAPFLSLVYEPTTAVWWTIPRIAASILGLSLLEAAWLLKRNQVSPQTWFWLGWVVFGFLPTANVFQQQTPFDERHALVFLIGILGMAGTLLCAWFPQPGQRKRLLPFAVVLVIALGGISFNRGFFFRDNETFVARWLISNPRSEMAHALMGEICQGRKDWNGAIFHYGEALRLLPDFPDVRNNLAILLLAMGRRVEAIVHFQEAVRIRPHMFDAHLNLARALIDEGNPAAAVSHLIRLCNTFPGNPEKTGKAIGLLLSQLTKTSIGWSFESLRRSGFFVPCF